MARSRGRPSTEAGLALQQPGGEFAFQPADLLAQGRLHEAQVLRRAAHAAQLHNPHEIAQLAQFHRKKSLHASRHVMAGIIAHL
jgi:hypothetical protein